MVDRLGFQQYLVVRKFWQFLGATFWIYDPQGGLVFYSKLKAFKLREDIRLYTGEDMQTEVLAIQARQIIDFGATYDVVDSVTNQKVGAVRRKGFKSMLKDEWVILDNNDRELGFIKEDSLLLALIRRTLTNLVPQKYHGEVNGLPVCTFKQNFNPFTMKLNLDFSPDNGNLLDRRLGLAVAVLLCAIEGKQN